MNFVAANVPNNILRNLPICSFASFLIILLTPLISNPESAGLLLQLESLDQEYEILITVSL